jgi:hypothetical protein
LGGGCVGGAGGGGGGGARGTSSLWSSVACIAVQFARALAVHAWRKVPYYDSLSYNPPYKPST